MRSFRTFGSLLLVLVALSASASAAAPKKVVLIAGKKSHGPVGNGIHDYPWSVKLLKVMLDNSNVAGQLRVEYHLEGWPENPKTLDDADTIMIVSDGRDGDLYEEAPHFQSQEKRDLIAKQIARGCGFVTFHFSTFAPDKYAADILSWSGAYFDWETDGQRKWYSAIQTLEGDVAIATPEHPVSRGLKPFKMKEEFYYNLRFGEQDEALKPILTVAALPGREPDGKVVAWARTRKDGGRGFGTTCGHFYDNWKQPEFRRMMLNAIVWTAGADVPQAGVEARFYTHEEVTGALAGVTGTQPALVDDKPIHVLILTGDQHPAHKWKDTTPALKAVLERDPRMRVDVSEKVEDLAGDKLGRYDLLVLNYCNWQKPGLSDAAKAGFLEYLANGGGLCLIHFSNGAFHFSLPGAGESDWPEYRKICRRVWDHTAGKSGHDAFGKFIVEIEPTEHPVTAGVKPFETTDELYFRQQGNEPITVLAKARSQVTGQFEPMAFVYDYQKARIFQTVLGHAVDSIRTDGTATLIRRAAAWVARREPAKTAQLKPDEAVPAAKASVPLTEGRFGKALNAEQGALYVAGKTEYRQPPITVECWAKLRDKGPFNILVANELKTSATHWEMFTFTGSGHYCIYMPGMEPDHARSEVNICDGKWHYLAMIYEPARVRLYVDGKQVADQPMKPRGGATVPGQLAFGKLVSREIGCLGVIDEVRISKGVREIKDVPDKPFPADDSTLGLWHFDAAEKEEAVPDESSLKNPARIDLPAKTSAAPAKGKIDGHWGEDAVGFRWTEQDSADNRWNDADVGPFLASIVQLPDRPPVQKGLSLRLGERQEVSVCYDTATAALRAAWTGGFLRFHPARFGLISPPQIAGDLLFVADVPAGESRVQYRGLSLHGNRVVLRARVGTTDVFDSPWTEKHNGLQLITRTIEVGPAEAVLQLPLVAGERVELKTIDGVPCALVTQGEQTTAIALRDASEQAAATLVARDKHVVLAVPAGRETRRVKLLIGSVRADQLAGVAAAARSTAPPHELKPLLAVGKPRWTAPITTAGVIGKDDGPYVVDTLTLPFDNPYRALMFVSGHDFFANGDMAVSTVHGDVWRVSGVDATLGRLTWKRFATGLFQPLGLKIVDDRVYVLGRDQITRLADANDDGEADVYECFSNAHVTSAGGHDYVACLETDSDGNFYFIHATQGIVKVSRDGKRTEIVATGFRNPNGLSVGPDGTLTTAPQEGEWTPASNLIQVRPGGYYGYGGPKPDVNPPLGYDLPVCWIPRLRDNSSGGQEWVRNARWGPFEGQLLHFSYGKCRMMLVLRETIDGVTQGGTVEFPFEFESGAMRGRFSPRDGALYVSGLRGWVSSAARDGCLQRVRYTGRPVPMPTQVRTLANGLAITFAAPLHREAAEQPDNYTVQQWNYLYSRSYGSPEYRVSAPREEGRDDVMVQSATLLDDQRTVFLEIDDLAPANVVSIRWQLRGEKGPPIDQTLAWTIHRVGTEVMDPSRLSRQQRPGVLTKEETERLARGLGLKWSGANSRPRRIRMAAWHVAEGTPATELGDEKGLTAEASGYLKSPARGIYQFAAEGNGAMTLAINGHELPAIEGNLASAAPVPVSLHQGYNRIQIRYTRPHTAETPHGPATFRLLWSGGDFPLEAVPPDLLWCDASSSDLVNAARVERGRELFATHHCAACHKLPGGIAVGPNSMPELQATAPDLGRVASRCTTEWLQQWLLDPTSLRSHATMPQLLAPGDKGRQQAADLVAWLASLDSSDPRDANPLPETDGTSARATAEQGRALSLDLGCIGCHRMTPPRDADEHNRISLRFAAHRFRPAALETFLERPQAHVPWTRMPDFHLTRAESTALAAWIRTEARDVRLPSSETPFPPGEAARGKALFTSLRCIHCHSTGADSPTRPPDLESLFAASSNATPRDGGLRGCLALDAAARKTAPVFAESLDRKAIRDFLDTDGLSLGRTNTAETSDRLMQSLRCAACHPRDGVSSPRASLILDEGEADFVPEQLPNLTWTGEKLHAAWMEPFLKGGTNVRTRPWLKARMPSFPAYASDLARGLAAQHGVGSADAATHDFDPSLAALGKKLVEKTGGLDCRQCHGIGRLEPQGDANTKLAPGINFALTRDRVRSEFFHRFVLDPPRYDVGTRMPKLSSDGRTTKLTDVLDGDARRQFDAIWHHIQASARFDE